VRDAGLRKIAGTRLSYDPAESARGLFARCTKGIIVNTPHNPTGKVFTREELTEIARCARSSTR